MILRTLRGNDLQSEVLKALERAFSKTMSDSGKMIVDALMWTTKNHIASRYPGSTHWDPSKVERGDESATSTSSNGSINIGIEGAGRAYHDVTILPIRAKRLTIPIHAASYGKRAGDFKDLFTIKGKNALFQKHGGGIIALFALATKAFQKQDTSLLPSDDTYSKNIEERFVKAFNANIDKEAKSI